jgi:iron complex outermembrane receptor protein
VQADRSPRALATSASLTVVPLGEALGAATDVAAAVERATGTTVRRLGGLGDFSAVSVRGSSFRQVEVFLDGVPLNPDGAAAIDLSSLPASAFERLELYRGNAPARFGSAAMGGILNLVTPAGGGAPMSASAAGGSWGTFRTSAAANPTVGSGDVLLAAEQFHTDGDFTFFDDQGTEYNLYDDRTSERLNNALDRFNVLGRVRAGRVTVLDSFGHLGAEFPGNTGTEAGSASYGSTRNLLSTQAALPVGGRASLTPGAWWLRRTERYDDRAAEIGVGAQWETATYDTVAGQLTGDWVPREWLNGTAILRYRRDSYAGEDLLAGEERVGRSRDAGLGAVSADGRWGPLTLTPVLHAELLQATEGQEDTDEFFALPRVGGLLRPVEHLALKGNIGRYVRAPDFTELFGDHGTLVGNDALKPESGWAWDAGVVGVAPGNPVVDGRLEVTIGQRYARDLIVWVQNGQDTSIAANVGEAFVGTAELAAEADLLDTLSTATSVTNTLARNLRTESAYSNNELPRIPPWELAQTTTLHWGERAALSHTWSWASATFTDEANVYQTAPRDLHSVALSLALDRRWPTLKAEVLNLFDVRGEAVDIDPLNEDDDTPIAQPLTDFNGYPLPGRTVMVAVSWTDSPRKNP